MTFQKGDLVKGRNVGGLYLVISNKKKDSHHNDCYEVYVLSTPYNFEKIGTKTIMNKDYVDRCFDKIG